MSTATMPAPVAVALKTWRCWSCGRILARLRLAPGSTVEVKCKCNAMNTACA